MLYKPYVLSRVESGVYALYYKLLLLQIMVGEVEKLIHIILKTVWWSTTSLDYKSWMEG